MKAPWNFIRYFPLAQRLIKRGKIPALLFAVARKSSSKRGLFKGLREDLALLQALCVAWWRGEYRAISPNALIAVVAGLLYFLSPIDAIPDWQAQTADRQASLQRLPALDEPKAGGQPS